MVWIILNHNPSFGIFPDNHHVVVDLEIRHFGYQKARRYIMMSVQP